MTLADARQAAKLRQEDVAIALGVTKSAVSQWESGATKPSLVSLAKLSRLYGVSSDDLLDAIANCGD